MIGAPLDAIAVANSPLTLIGGRGWIGRAGDGALSCCVSKFTGSALVVIVRGSMLVSR